MSAMDDSRPGALDSKPLRARIWQLERERADALEASNLLLRLLEASRRIVATRDPDEIVAQVLRAMREPLGFSRAIYFSVDRARGIEARWQIDGGDVVERSDEELDTAPGSVVLGVLRGEPDGIGRAGELSAPMVDVRGWYVLCALIGAEETIGVLYVDGHPSRGPLQWEAELVRYLASVAATAIDNGVLFARTQELAARDPLTGLYNRRAFAERMTDTLENSERNGASFAYVMIDVDDFKGINDRHGHAHGDDVLRELAATLLHSSRANDVVGRYAGDEFAVLIANVDAELARTLVGRLSADLRARNLRCSLGAALFP
ncbi:MAG: sensor domain-containing diguanylate cyclase, partial [Candidatus Eremiobacteraeota bacterium]|nr:sensor domain-containing diguanylate cyclase [Candidatus Eremiobacteraeota bacterium]